MEELKSGHEHTSVDCCIGRADVDPATVAERPESSSELVGRLVDELVAALLNTQIYFSGHPRVRDSVEALQRILRRLRERIRVEEIRLSTVGDFLVFEQRPLLGASLSAARLIRTLDAWGAGGVTFRARATREDFRALVDGLLSRPAEGDDFSRFNLALSEKGCESVRLLPPFHEDVRREGGEVVRGRVDQSLLIPMQLYQASVELLQNITMTVCQGGRIQFEPVMAHAEEVLRRLDSDDGPMLNLARHEQYDAFTFGHSVRVAVLAMNYSRSLTDDHDMLLRLGSAALLHDVGKSLIPFEILHSRARLSEAERREIMKHPDLGAEILLGHRDADPLAVAAAFGHHKTAENQGYPYTLHEHQLSTITEIVKVCDTYEALTAARPYKPPLPPIRAYRIMMAMKGQFDPRHLKRFIRANGIYPTGQVLRLDTGETTRVVRQTGDLLRPAVRVLTDPAGEPLGEGAEWEIDLSQGEGRDRTVETVVRQDDLGEAEERA